MAVDLSTVLDGYTQSAATDGTTATGETNVFLTKTRVYIAGVLMPNSQIHVEFDTQEGIPTAFIDVPSDPRMFYVGRNDKIPVHIFVKETVAASPKFILLFEGYVASKEYSNEYGDRRISLMCNSYATLLRDARLGVMSSLNDYAEAHITGGPINGIPIHMMGVAFPTCLLFKGLAYSAATINDPEQVKRITMPTEYLENAIRFLYDAGTKDASNNVAVEQGEVAHAASAGRYHHSITGQFYSNEARNLKLRDRYTWLPYFDTAVDGVTASGTSGETGNINTSFPGVYGLQAKAAYSALLSSVEYSTPNESILETLVGVSEQADYNFQIIPNPAFYADKELTKHSGTSKDGGDIINQEGKEEEFVQNNQINDAFYGPDVKKKRIVSLCMKPQLWDTMPPQCNIIFRSQVTELNAHIPYYQLPTRVYMTGYLPQQSIYANPKNDVMFKWGDIGYFPSNMAYNTTIDRDKSSSRNLNVFTSELLKTEKYTGPFVKSVNAPPYLAYLGTPNSSGAGKEDLNTLKVRYLRHTLMLSRYAENSVSATITFNPYVTPGFPGVIFDGSDTGFAFAGYITDVAHMITATGTFTQVKMSFCRLLDEAANYEIPAVVKSVHLVTHNKERLAKIYQSLLGTPGDTTIPGAQPRTFTEIKNLWGSGTVTGSLDPQNNIQHAYQLQRRNIVTFEDYCDFMGFTVNGNASVGSDNVLVFGKSNNTSSDISIEGLLSTTGTYSAKKYENYAETEDPPILSSTFLDDRAPTTLVHEDFIEEEKSANATPTTDEVVLTQGASKGVTTTAATSTTQSTQSTTSEPSWYDKMTGSIKEGIQWAANGIGLLAPNNPASGSETNVKSILKAVYERVKNYKIY